MVRFSQTLEDTPPRNRKERHVRQGGEQHYEQRSADSRTIDDIVYSQFPRPKQVKRSVYRDENYVEPEAYEPINVLHEQPQIERESIQPDYSKPELTFPADQNIQFGVEYSPNSRPPVIGKNYTIRSNSIIYNDVVIGDNFRTGHNVVIRENTNIGDDVLIGTNTVIEGDVIIGNDVSIQSNVYIPTNNTTFLSNVEVGEGSIVAAGAIVIHSVPPFYLAIGTPARIKPLPDHLKVPNRF